MVTWEEVVKKNIIKNHDKVKQATQPLHDLFGIAYFTYHRITNEGNYTVLLDRPDWAEHYVSEKYYLLDPYLQCPDVFETGVTMIDSNGTEEYKQKVLEGGSKFDLELGVLLIEKKSDYVEFFGFSGNRKSSALEKLYFNHMPLLKSFAVHFSNEFSPLLNKMEPSPLSLLKGGNLHDKTLIHTHIPTETKRKMLITLGLGDYVEKADNLSFREKQCLQGLLNGDTAKETAKELKLSSRTIEFYLENIKNKLECYSKKELFEMAKALSEYTLLL